MEMRKSETSGVYLNLTQSNNTLRNKRSRSVEPMGGPPSNLENKHFQNGLPFDLVLRGLTDGLSEFSLCCAEIGCRRVKPPASTDPRWASFKISKSGPKSFYVFFTSKTISRSSPPPSVHCLPV